MSSRTQLFFCTRRRLVLTLILPQPCWWRAVFATSQHLRLLLLIPTIKLLHLDERIIQLLIMTLLIPLSTMTPALLVILHLLRLHLNQ